MEGDGSLNVASNFTWSGGSLQGRLKILRSTHALIPANAPAELRLSGATVVNAGTWDWNGGNLGGEQGAQFLNDGTFVMHHNGSFSFASFGSGAMPVFANRGPGTFIKTNDLNTGRGKLDVPFNNAGVVRVEGGNLTLAGGGTNSNAGYSVSTGATNEFFSGSYYFTRANALGGDGWSRGVGGTLTVQGSLTTRNLALLGSTLGGPGTLTAEVNLSLQAGTLAPAFTDLAPFSRTAITGTVRRHLAARSPTAAP